MAAIIQFSDGTYHGGGTAYLKPVKKIAAAKTYTSPKKALAILRQLHVSRHARYEDMIEGAVVWEVEYNFVKGFQYETSR